jgi:hypothetical protein
MIEWAFLLTPLLVLPIVLLFRFVGCGHPLAISPEVDQSPPRYRDYIMGEPNNPGVVVNDGGVVPNKADVIAYWRLVDVWKLVDSAAGKIAKDQIGVHDGSYVQRQSLSEQAPTPTEAGSESASGAVYSNHYSLIDSDTSSLCHTFDGGFVLVPSKPGLYTEEFTIECWIEVNWTMGTGYEHTLFSAGGFYRVPFTASTASSYQGFRIFADRDNRWQMEIFSPSGQVFSTAGNVFTSPPAVPRNGRTHLAVTVQKDPANVSNRIVTLYSDLKVAALQTVGFYALPEGAPLLIGVGSTHPLDPNSPQAYQPVLSPIQEVVLYRKALSAAEIFNHVTINRK